DCGIYEAHPDLAGKVVDRQDFTGDVANSPTDPATNDRCNHGTHVAGIASAVTNNNTGVAGVGYNTALMNGKVLIETYIGSILTGEGTTSWIVAGIEWAASSGANVINMSLGGQGLCTPDFNPFLQQAVDDAWSKNVVIVAAAGNDNLSESFYPADCNHVVAVASTDSTDGKSSFSNYGTWVPVAAPGSNIYSTINPNLNNGASYRTLSGTSMASPHVAGLAALLWATTYGTSANAVVSRLEATADPIAGTGANWLYGRINAQAAVAGGAL